MIVTPGWKRFADYIKENAEQVGLAAVYPGLKSDVLMEKLTRANEGLRLIMHVEKKASQVEELEEKAKVVKQIK